MTDQRDKAMIDPACSASEVPVLPAPAPMSRRVLIRGASAAIPTILTLHSGSAIAAMTSAALITPSNQPEGNNYLCLSEVSAGPDSGTYLVDPPLVDGDITVIDGNETYYIDANASVNKQVTPLEMCANAKGETQLDPEFWYKPGGSGSFTSKTVNKGIVVSCDAVRSFGSVSACNGDF